MNHLDHHLDDTLIDLRYAQAAGPVVIVCEHASAHIPARFDNLGLAGDTLHSHIAWDPGAAALADRMAQILDAVFVAAKTSRLVYDCNRPPDAPDAVTARSEAVDVPGNVGLSAAEMADRVATYYEPFRAAVSQVIAKFANPVLVTVHSFSPVYHGKSREVEVGILHDSDARLADAILSDDAAIPHIVRRNEPYGPADGVTHTLKEHGAPGGHLNVMIEVRNDLISTDAEQSVMADTLTASLTRALSKIGAGGC